ncbi:methyltransferase [Nocardia stercoris]|nr:class I SAM-dependent methyltransferase [Nocardia stercoris]
MSENVCAGDSYDVEFSGGHKFRLYDRPGTFRVSRAGLALGDHLVGHLREHELGGRILDAGTGSGVIALLLRSMGATSIAATDICAAAVATARQNESENFGDSIVDFTHCDLFPGEETDSAPYDLIVFNPPGWRAPPGLLETELGEKFRSLNLDAMFYGDRVLLRFLQLLPEHLAENGRAIVGLNSLVGIADIIRRARAAHRSNNGPALHSQLLDRFEFPLMFYTDEWQEARASLVREFERGREEYAAHYVTRDDTIHWFYEITEMSVTPLPVPGGLPPLAGVAAHERTAG